MATVKPVNSRPLPLGTVGPARVPAGGWQSPGAARCSSISERPCPGGGCPRGSCAHGQPGHCCFPARLHGGLAGQVRGHLHHLGWGTPGWPHSGCVRGEGDTLGEAVPVGLGKLGAGTCHASGAQGGVCGARGCPWGRDTSRPWGHGDGSPHPSAESGPAPCRRRPMRSRFA